MGGMIGNNKKRISMSSSSLTLLFSPINNNNNEKSSIIKRFQANDDRVVGLGIVAALGEGEEGDTSSNSIISSSSSTYKKEAFFFPNINPPRRRRRRRSTTTHHRSPAAAVVSTRSNPIPILTPLSKPPVVELPILFNHHHHHINNNNDDDDEIELSEEYTCVISHIGHNLIKKTEYFDYGVLAALHTHSSTVTYSGGGDEVVAVKTESFQAADFLKSCYLCDKHLHGLDIFMYRGEKAFCSAECRYEQMVKDERKEKEKEKLKKKNRGSLGKEATTMKTMMMNKPSFEFSSSTPCSSPIQLIAGIVAA